MKLYEVIRICCLYVFCYYHILSYSLGYIFVINVHMAVYLFNIVIYVFLLLCICILIVRLLYFHRASWHSSATLIEVFPCFFLSCKANARVKPAKMGHGPQSSKFLCCSMYYLFCVVLFIVCV